MTVISAREWTGIRAHSNITMESFNTQRYSFIVVHMSFRFIGGAILGYAGDDCEREVGVFDTVPTRKTEGFEMPLPL
jgi:hypothetical protein